MVRVTVDEKDIRQYFEQHGILVPEAPIARTNLYRFLKMGNGTLRGVDEKGRITYTKRMQERWVGKRVSKSHLSDRRHGRIKHLTARKHSTVVHLKEEMASDGLTDPHILGAFEAFVEWDEGRPSIVTLRYLELEESTPTVG